MRKNCLVIGYMSNNFGDDLFFQILFDRYPNVDFYFYPPSMLLERYKKIFKGYKNVIFYENEEQYIVDKRDYPGVPINLFPMICERAKKVDFIINIGGSIFIQNPNWKNDDRFTIKEFAGNTPYFIIGCNFGPGDEEFYNYYKDWFKQVDDICFRDMESYNSFKELSNVRVADDIVLIKKKKVKTIKNGLAISVMDLEHYEKIKSYKREYYNFIVRLIRKFIKEKQTVALFSYCDNDGDLKAANEIVDKLYDYEKEKVEIVNYDSEIDKFYKKWSKYKYVVGTRFHSMILALANEQDFLALTYSKKTYNYLKYVDENAEVVDFSKIEKLDVNNLKFNKISRNYNAEAQFKKIDEFLKNK